jgi:CRP/FNR family transcriptional regulator, cyclic AMP receptor protein
MVAKAFLRSHALFGGLTDEQLDYIVPLLEEVAFGDGEFVVREGGPGDRLYFICSGRVEVVKRVPADHGGGLRSLAVFQAGDTFGEMELIDIQPRSASVRALEPVTALALSNRSMYLLSKKDLMTFTMVVMNIAREISRRLRKMDSYVVDSLFGGEEREKGT